MRDINAIIAFGLRAGVFLSVLFILAGLVLISLNGGIGSSLLPSAISSKLAVTTYGFSTAQLISGLASFDGLSFVYMGIIILVATPVIRVILSVISFALERNPVYIAITIIVLTNLLISIFVVPLFIK
ncbi:MAG: DUF1634 domain-containing protein [Candidatus Micrarchaeaceae archaeon]